MDIVLGMETEVPQSTADCRQERRPHLLVISGTAAFLSLMRDLLHEHFHVTATNLVPTTLTQLAALAPDALIVDMAVGLQAGWGQFERLHADARSTDIPVLVVTTDPSLVERAQDEAPGTGHRRYRAKPTSFDELLAQIQELGGGPPRGP